MIDKEPAQREFSAPRLTAPRENIPGNIRPAGRWSHSGGGLSSRESRVPSLESRVAGLESRVPIARSCREARRTPNADPCRADAAG